MTYKINNNTYALIPVDNKTKIIEKNKINYINKTLLEILDENCKLNGSTLEGRKKGSAYLLGSYYKTPIILDEINNIILIPTHSIRNKECIWLNLNVIINYEKKYNKYLKIEFLNNQIIHLKISYNTFDKQILKATKLKHLLDIKKSTNIHL